MGCTSLWIGNRIFKQNVQTVLIHSRCIHWVDTLCIKHSNHLRPKNHLEKFWSQKALRLENYKLKRQLFVYQTQQNHRQAQLLKMLPKRQHFRLNLCFFKNKLLIQWYWFKWNPTNRVLKLSIWKWACKGCQNRLFIHTFKLEHTLENRRNRFLPLVVVWWAFCRHTLFSW